MLLGYDELMSNANLDARGLFRISTQVCTFAAIIARPSFLDWPLL